MKILSDRRHQHRPSIGEIPDQSFLSVSSCNKTKENSQHSTSTSNCGRSTIPKSKNEVTGGQGIRNSEAMTPDIYHERQVRALCALHALNNLFQGPVFSKEDLDTICNTLAPDAWLNPHKSVLGLGNYDINVIMTALQTRGYEAIWFDKRKDPSTLNLPAIYGFIFNIPSDCKFGWVSLPLKRKHWFAVKCFAEDYYNIDSKLDSPVLIGKASALIALFREELQSKEKELFLVMRHDGNQTQNSNQSTSNQLLNLPDGKGSTSSSIRKESTDSGVVELLERDTDLNIVDLDKEPSEEERLRFS